jgi:hypothetical protein
MICNPSEAKKRGGQPRFVVEILGVSARPIQLSVKKKVRVRGVITKLPFTLLPGDCKR